MQFNTLEELERYAASHDENITSDNGDILNPDFSIAYNAQRKSFFQELLSYVGLNHNNDEWNANDFKNLLERILETKKQDTSIKNGELTIQIPPTGICVFWGDLYGAFHSLVRTLLQCKKLGLIDENLHILNDTTYFVFLGNAIDQSAYSLETLTIILTLIEKNPKKVIYLQGEHEINGYWENFTMRTQLKKMASQFLSADDEAIPLSHTINKFFATLPKVLIIHRDPLEHEQAIYATHRKLNIEALNRYETEVLIFGSEEFETMRKHGLEFRGYMYGTALWSIISCPIPLYKKLLQFYCDCFAIVTMGDIVLRSYITAYAQNSELKNGFTSQIYDILYGIPVQNINDIKKIHANRPYEVGSTGPLSGGESSLGTSESAGFEAALYNFNSAGGAHNLYIRNSMFDDQLIPRLAQKNIEVFQTYGEGPGALGGNIILAPVGTETLLSYFDKVKSNDIAVLFPYTGNKVFRDPSLKSIVHFTPSHAQELTALVSYMINEYNASSFAFFYENDEFGIDALEAAHSEMGKQGITTWTDIPYSREQTNFSYQVNLLKNANPDAIGFFSSSSSAQEFINQVGAEFFVGRHLFGISFVESRSIILFLKKIGVPITFSYLVPNPEPSDLPLLQKYHKAMDQFKIPYDDNSLMGFVAGELFVDAFKHIKPPLTKEAIVKYFENFKNYNFEGLTLTFNPQDRSLSQPVWIKNEEDKWIKYDT